MIQVPCPDVGREYGKYYGGVDMFDQYIERYRIGRRTYRYWQYIFYWLLNAALVNAYLIFTKASTTQRKKNYGQLDFRLAVAESLIGDFSCRRKNPGLPVAGLLPARPNHESVRMEGARGKTCRGHRRFFGKNSQTIYGCKICGIYLCKQCFVLYHAPN